MPRGNKSTLSVLLVGILIYLVHRHSLNTYRVGCTIAADTDIQRCVCTTILIQVLTKHFQ